MAVNIQTHLQDENNFNGPIRVETKMQATRQGLQVKLHQFKAVRAGINEDAT
jgi:hypothetical protein